MEVGERVANVAKAFNISSSDVPGYHSPSTRRHCHRQRLTILKVETLKAPSPRLMS